MPRLSRLCAGILRELTLDKAYRLKLVHCIVSLAVSLTFLGCLPAKASPQYIGTVSATWSNPVLSGAVIDGVTRAPTFPSDNSTTAICSIITGTPHCPFPATGGPLSTLEWGDQTPNRVDFAGAAFNVAPGQVFDMGTLTYFNGTNFLQSLIFGADLTLSFSLTTGTAVSPELIRIGIVGTANDGSPQDNADFLTFSGISKDLSVYENGAATAHLFGKIVGDPQAFLVDIVLDPNSVNTGFISSGPTGTLPESSTLSILGLGFIGLAAFLGRSRKSSSLRKATPAL